MDRQHDGYITDVEFEDDYRWVVSPTLLRCLTESLGASLPASRPLRYLELGCGTGLSLNIHAAACPGEYWGTDINPLHVESARALARAAATRVQVLDRSFADLLECKDLPQFDVIVAHGVWSWVSEKNRSVIVELLRRHLAQGGIYCMNWLVLPGAATALPFKQLMRLQMERARPDISSHSVKAGISLAKAMQAAGSEYFAPSSPAGRLLKWSERINTNSLAHEFLGKHWQPALFAETAARLFEGGLSFACSAMPHRNYEELRFSPAQRAMLDSIDDPWLRETTKDFLRERQQRVDIFVKATVPATPSQRPRLARQGKFILAASHVVAVQHEASTAIGTLRFSEAPFRQIIDRLATDGHRPKSLEELMADGLAGVETEAQFERAVVILVATRTVHEVATATPAAEVIEACANLNHEILRRSLAPNAINVLASPVTGGGVELCRVEQLCLSAMHQGARSADQRAEFTLEAHRQASLSVAKSDVLKEVLLFETRLPALAALGLVGSPTNTVREQTT